MEEAGEQMFSLQSGVLVTPTVLWLGFVLFLGVVAIISAILLYHWHKYTFDNKIAKKVMAVYFSVSGIFVLLLVVSLLIVTF
jgi:multidrug resistance efflux pump